VRSQVSRYELATRYSAGVRKQAGAVPPRPSLRREVRAHCHEGFQVEQAIPNRIHPGERVPPDHALITPGPLLPGALSAWRAGSHR